MIIYFIIILLLSLGLIFTAVNFQYTTTLSLVVYKIENLPGVFLLYIGVIIGAIITIPFVLMYSRRYATLRLNKSIKQESKKLKKQEKLSKKNTASNKRMGDTPREKNNKIN